MASIVDICDQYSLISEILLKDVGMDIVCYVESISWPDYLGIDIMHFAID